MSMMLKNSLAARESLNNYNSRSTELEKSLGKISSGQKINSVGDDSAGYSISERMRVLLRGLDQGKKNVQDGSAMIKTAEAGVQGIVELLREMKELAINSANDSNSDEDRRALQKEFAQRIDTINDIALSTQFNGKRLIDGTYETKMTLEEIIVGWKKSNLQSFTLAPNRTNEKVLYIDGSRVVTTENNVKNLTRNFTPVNSTIKDILTKSLLKSWTTPRLDCDTGFDGVRSTWNWADAYNQEILAATSGTVTTVFDGTDTTPSTPQQVMKAFMSSLDETTLSGNAALNEAINYSTGGKFATKDALVNQFMSDLNGAASYTDFFKHLLRH